MSSWTSTLRFTGLGAVVAAALALVLVMGGGAAQADLSLNAAKATITVDGNNADWAAVTGATVTLKQIEIPAGSDWDEPGAVDPINATVKVATDDNKIYVLFEVPDDYDFDPADHNLSASPNVMFLIDPAAGPHMGAGDDDFETSLGMVDIWHWELDCAAGVTSGGGAGSGDDPDCNLDDEFSTDPEAREDDGGGDTPNAAAENSIAGVWSHTSATIGEAGTWTFEFSRPLQTGDPEDAQFAAGGTARMALAYFDPDEGAAGWTDTGHLVSSDAGWIVVNLPGAATQVTPTPGTTVSPGAVPSTGGAPDSGAGGLFTPLLLVLALGSSAVVAGFAALYLRARARAG